MTMFLSFGKCLRALNSEGVKFSGGSRSLKGLCYEVCDVSNIIALIKDISSLHPQALCRRIVTQK